MVILLSLLKVEQYG
ncbi:MAG: hypothetical protein EZS28_047290, partial [Streblomastix strix]